MLDRVTVDHIAELAQLARADDEREAMRAKLAHIVTYVDQLAALDLDTAAAVFVVGLTGMV